MEAVKMHVNQHAIAGREATARLLVGYGLRDKVQEQDGSVHFIHDQALMDATLDHMMETGECLLHALKVVAGYQCWCVDCRKAEEAKAIPWSGF